MILKGCTMGKALKILIVEDEAIFAIYLKKQLQLYKYDMCKSVSTGEDAIKSVQDENPDVILIDINLAERMDGITAAEKIKSLYDIPVIFMTGYDNEDLKNRAKKLNPVAYLIKPIKIIELNSIISSVQNLK